MFGTSGDPVSLYPQVPKGRGKREVWVFDGGVSGVRDGSQSRPTPEGTTVDHPWFTILWSDHLVEWRLVDGFNFTGTIETHSDPVCLWFIPSVDKVTDDLGRDRQITYERDSFRRNLSLTDVSQGRRVL